MSINRLDANRYTQVIFSMGDEDSMLTGEGNGRYNVCIGQCDDKYYTLLDREKSPQEIESLMTGGLLSNFPAKSIVGIQLVNRAVQTYFRDKGKMDEGLMWSKD